MKRAILVLMAAALMFGQNAKQKAASKAPASAAPAADQSRITNLTVPAGKRVCAATDAAAVQVAWHAHTGDVPVRSIDVALLSR